MSDETDPTEIIQEALRDYVGDADGADEAVLAAHDAQVLARVLPSRADVARIIAPDAWGLTDLDWHDEHGRTSSTTRSLTERLHVRHWSLSQADAVLALLPGRHEDEIKAEALREAVETLNDASRDTDAVKWLAARADGLGKKSAP